MLSRLGRSKPVTLRTAQTWLNAMGYQYGKTPRGMYVDGHERKDVVDYRQHVFLPLWAELEKRMALEPETTRLPSGENETDQTHRIVLVTHDESTFYANDQRQLYWAHIGQAPTPRPKGEGVSIMISDFCTPEAGWLKSADGYAAPFKLLE